MYRRTIATFMLAASMLTGSALAATADSRGSSNPALQNAPSSFSRVIPGGDEVCQEVKAKQGGDETCDLVQSGGTGAATAVKSASEIPAADLNLVAEDGTTLREAVAAAAVSSKPWWQANNAGAWEEKHSGAFYYDGARAWRSYHNCNQGYSLGATVTVTSCTGYGNNTSRLAEWDYYRVTILNVGKSYNMHVNLYPSGAVYYHF